jgi:2-keto-4-pentenoate hydratase/2-oxohepta-3-ene-1,7-dioic acid hydratase in catechol pathway
MSAYPPAIICVGRNYAAHAAEMKGDVPTAPTIFMKNPASLSSNGAPIVIPSICHEHGPQVDFEGELAVVLGEDCRDVPRDHALGCVCAYAVANDVTARWWQKHGSGGQWIRGKSFDTFCPMTSPIPACDIKDPQALRVCTKVNGVCMQDGQTSDMLFPVDALISELSRGLTLLKGTVLLTGTPAGVGAARTPPCFLADGDCVEVEIAGVGLLRNTVQG